MKVCKFGGSSLADATQIAKVCDIVMADADRRIVVVSAPGKRSTDDVKVTDLLIACAQNVLSGTDDAGGVDYIVARYASIQSELGLESALVDEIEVDLRERLLADTSVPERFMDAIKAAGEDYCARLVAEALVKRGAQAVYVNPGDAGMLLSDEFGHARLLPQSLEGLSRLREREDIVVFPGFFGYTRDGHIATFSRGGSDITGSILSVAVQADIYENFTDVDSVLAADPRIVPDAAPIAELTYREMRELSYAGFNVLHDEAIVPAVQAGIPIQIRNTNRVEAPGTTIVTRHRIDVPRVVGIASDEGFCTIFLRKYLMNRELGFGRRLLQILEDEKLSYEHLPSGIDDMSAILRERCFTPEMERRVLDRIRQELEVDTVEVERGLALIMIVGEGMRYNIGLAARATAALARAGVNIEMMNQGSSELSIMFGVKAADRRRAVEFLYEAFFRDT